MGRNFASTWKSVSIAFFVFLFAIFISTAPALAQSAETGALSGTVTDPSGGVIAGATVTTTNIATGASRTATTDANGVYRVALLPPGSLAPATTPR